MRKPKTLRYIPSDPLGLHYPEYALYDMALREEAKAWAEYIIYASCGEEPSEDISAIEWIEMFFNLEHDNLQQAMRDTMRDAIAKKEKRIAVLKEFWFGPEKVSAEEVRGAKK
jgi:hypothetical protein